MRRSAFRQVVFHSRESGTDFHIRRRRHIYTSGRRPLLLPRIQRKPDRSAYIFAAADVNGLTVRFDDVFADSETETAARYIEAAAYIGAVETLEDAA